jgi:hypothetical protein
MGKVSWPSWATLLCTNQIGICSQGSAKQTWGEAHSGKDRGPVLGSDGTLKRVASGLDWAVLCFKTRPKR